MFCLLIPDVSFMVQLLKLQNTFFPGVSSVLVGLLAQKAEVKYNAKITNPEAISKWINDLGFESEPMNHQDGAKNQVEVIVSFLNMYILPVS